MSGGSVRGAVRRPPSRPRPYPAATVCSLLSAAWTAAYAVVYLLVAGRQSDSAVAWWYVAALAGSALVALVAPFTGARIGSSAAVAVLLAGCALLGILSLGLLLVPAVVLAILAAALPGGSHAGRFRPYGPGSPPRAVSGRGRARHR